MTEVTPPAGGNTTKRDRLLSIQREVQAAWAAEKAFEANAPSSGEVRPAKFFGTFPYPYMNGLLHLGHAFSLSKLIFASAYHRQLGERVLFAQSFHLTGMPIKACADKLRHEIDDLGFYPGVDVKAHLEARAAAEEAARAGPESAEEELREELAEEEAHETDPGKFSAKKSKAVAKQGVGSTQWEIMRLSGIPEADIPKFADAEHWLRFFPPLAVRDIEALGAGVDWRRSFVTTDINPYYDAFVRWQFIRLKERGKVVKDKRYAVYSPKDGQPCADHDRASGEGVGPQEYTLVLLEVVQQAPGLVANEKLAAYLAANPSAKLFLAAATLRPETLYGQTNAWMRPRDARDPTGQAGRYGAFRAANGDLWVLTRRAARNLAYQGWSAEPGLVDEVAQVWGDDVIGSRLRAPQAAREVYALPLLTIRMDKGTGVVTSVPSDSPDDYAALRDLVNKPALRARYHVADDMVLPYEVVPIITVPKAGDETEDQTAIAVALVERLKIASQNDGEKLARAKLEAYRRGFDTGVMAVGPHAGKPVRLVKEIIKKELLAMGPRVAAPYAEPEKPVVSRSDDDCVVALTDQWYLTYGEDEWRAAALDAIARMRWMDAQGSEGASPTRAQFEHALGWLNQWACSRSFGLGTRLPWDEQYLIESLSDSTVYMAYYTVAHVLQGDRNMYGENVRAEDGGAAEASGAERLSESLASVSLSSEAAHPAARVNRGVDPSLLTPENLDYVFLGAPLPAGLAALPEGAPERRAFARAREEFGYWYPMDLRVSGKDLIQNHLSFCLYSHLALWGPELAPRCFRCNGHVLLDSAKMSKSTGNFKTLQEALGEYGADALRLGLAVAGDSLDDANFERDAANNAVLRLYRLVEWAHEWKDGAGKAGEAASAAASAAAAPRQGSHSLWDRIFANELARAASRAKAAYECGQYREVVQAGWFELGLARDTYVVATAGDEGGVHADLIERYVDVTARIMAPITPHVAEYLWRDVLGRPGSVLTAGWPELGAPDFALAQAATHVDKLKKPIVEAYEKALLGGRRRKGGKGGKGGAAAAAAAAAETAAKVPSTVAIVVVDRYSGWKAAVLGALREAYDESLPRRFPADVNDRALAAAAASPELAAEGNPKRLRGTVMPFVSIKIKQANEGGADVLAERLPFDEADVLEQSIGYLLRALQEHKTLERIVVRKYSAEQLAADEDQRIKNAMPGEPVLIVE